MLLYYQHRAIETPVPRRDARETCRSSGTSLVQPSKRRWSHAWSTTPLWTCQTNASTGEASHPHKPLLATAHASSTTARSGAEWSSTLQPAGGVGGCACGGCRPSEGGAAPVPTLELGRPWGGSHSGQGPSMPLNADGCTRFGPDALHRLRGPASKPPGLQSPEAGCLFTRVSAALMLSCWQPHPFASARPLGVETAGWGRAVAHHWGLCSSGRAMLVCSIHVVSGRAWCKGGSQPPW
jgi:hypothetical protein